MMSCDASSRTHTNVFCGEDVVILRGLSGNCVPVCYPNASTATKILRFPFNMHVEMSN